MNNKNHDLFPATLLVDVIDGKTYTTSLRVAGHFQKQHRNVRRDIEKLLTDCPDQEFSLLNFEQSDYQNERGKTYSMFKMTEQGFALLAMGFTGQQALQWKIDFLNDFRAKERQLAAIKERYANAMHLIRPHYRTVGEGTEAGLSRTAICGMTGHRSPATITANRRRMRQLGIMGETA